MIVFEQLKLLRKYKQNTIGISTLWAYDTFNALTKHFEVDNVFDAFLPLTESIECYKKLDAVNEIAS
jgi:2-succinyl-5-enolpyruvyl-6-hydroxy-3-cyclohexene-1-carboxylate synthase